MQFDQAVHMFGLIIENALGERVNVGDSENPEYKSRYTLNQILEPDFRLPLEDDEEPLDELYDMDGAFYDEVD